MRIKLVLFVLLFMFLLFSLLVVSLTIPSWLIHRTSWLWCFAALGLALAAMVRRRTSAFGPAALIAVALYLLDLIAAAWPALESAAMLSPFHYYQGTAVFAGHADTAHDLLVLGTVSAALVSIAYWRFSVRDL